MIPGVESAGISDNLPMSRNRSWGIAAKGEQKKLDGQRFHSRFRLHRFARLPEGNGNAPDARPRSHLARPLQRSDVVIINQTVARKLWPGRNPIGRTAVAGGTDAEVIGVIADVRETGAEDNPGAQMYLPATKRFGPEGSLSGSAFEAASHDAGSKCDAHAARDESRTARHGIQANSDTGRPRDVSETLLCAAGRDLCWSRTASGFAGNLWGYLVFGYTANAGDRHPHGSWCNAMRGCNSM